MGVPVDLREDGLLWLINRVVFHPRGFALGYDRDAGTFLLLGDGSEPWRFGADAFDTRPDLLVDEDGLFAAAETAFQRARESEA